MFVDDTSVNVIKWIGLDSSSVYADDVFQNLMEVYRSLENKFRFFMRAFPLKLIYSILTANRWILFCLIRSFGLFAWCPGRHIFA